MATHDKQPRDDWYFEHDQMLPAPIIAEQDDTDTIDRVEPRRYERQIVWDPPVVQQRIPAEPAKPLNDSIYPLGD